MGWMHFVLPGEGYATRPAAIVGKYICVMGLMVGYPIVSVPLGTLNGTGQPFGLSFIGTKCSEPTLKYSIDGGFRDGFSSSRSAAATSRQRHDVLNK